MDTTQCDVIGIVHADTTFDFKALPIFAKTAYGENEKGQVTGLVGITLERRYVWSKEMTEVTPVSTLDGCCLFLRKSSGLRFSEVYKSFHCGTEDVCLLGHAKGIPVVVPPAQADHYSGERGTYLIPAWQSEYWSYREILGKKWPGTCPTT